MKTFDFIQMTISHNLKAPHPKALEPDCLSPFPAIATQSLWAGSFTPIYPFVFLIASLCFSFSIPAFLRFFLFIRQEAKVKRFDVCLFESQRRQPLRYGLHQIVVTE